MPLPRGNEHDDQTVCVHIDSQDMITRPAHTDDVDTFNNFWLEHRSQSQTEVSVLPKTCSKEGILRWPQDRAQEPTTFLRHLPILANTRHYAADAFSTSKTRLTSLHGHFRLCVCQGRLLCQTNPMRWIKTRAEQVLASIEILGASKDPGHVLRRGRYISPSLIRRLSQGCIGTPHIIKHHM